jgi:hypothetical protein
MQRLRVGALAALVSGIARSAWALSDADPGAVWIQAPFQQKVQVTNILSRGLGVEPGTLQQCLDKVFADPANASKAIRDAAQECKSQKR